MVGDALALVLAESPAQARAGAAAVALACEPLPAVHDPVAAMEPGAPALYPGGNVLAE